MTDPPRPSDDRQAALDRAEAWGVDLATLRDNLRLTPTQRVERHQRALELVTALRTASPLPDAPVPPHEAR